MQRTGSPITTETDIDLTAALLPSGGTRSHHHAIKTAVSETGTLPVPGYEGPPFPAGCRGKPQTGALPGAGCRLWNVPCPKLPPAGGPGKAFGQSTLPFSFGTSAVPPHSKLPAGVSRLGSGPGARGEPGRCGGLKGLDLERWEGPETEPGLDTGRAPSSAFEKLRLREGSPWADARPCSVQPGWAGPRPEIHPGPQEELGDGGGSPSAAIGPPEGSTIARRAESTGPGGSPLASETAAEPRRHSSIAQSAGAEPAMGREGTQDGPCPASTVHLQRLAVVGRGLAPGAPPEPGARGREEEAEARRHQGPELGRQPGASSSAGPAGPGRESSEPVAQETAGQAQRPRGLRSAAGSAPTKTSVEDAYGRLTKACGLSLLEELRRTFLDAEGGCLVLLDSGLLLGRVEEHPALGLAVLVMRDGRKLATALPSSSLFLYYALGRQFYVWEQLADCWFRARDRVSGESMLMKKVRGHGTAPERPWLGPQGTGLTRHLTPARAAWWEGAEPGWGER
ncbi:uncharacterized protein LOC142830345 [Pelodiscus sinensis]|uniref:uncharacterized protein LOC142830345 n=1 Tax=Pelodiscus sinensis TaxID=13735 RepID=UPI003F6D0593